MQIHNDAISRFGESTVSSFWKIVESIGWDENSVPRVIKADLMAMLSPREADTYKRICTFYTLNLLSELAVDMRKYGEGRPPNPLRMERAASNAVGGGKLNYEEYTKQTSLVLRDCRCEALEAGFSESLPDEEDYYSQS